MNPPFTASGSGRAASRGLTIVELLVAVVISLLLVIVIAQLFLGSRQTFSTTDDVLRMQENIRFTQQLLIRSIHLAGYKSQPNSVANSVFQATPALEASDGAALASDSFTIRYQGSGTGAGPAGCSATNSCAGADGTVVDCLGNKVDSGVMSTNIYSIDKGGNGRNALFCSVNGVLPGVELVPDVENMQVRYGEDTDNDLTANQYVPSGSVGNMTNVLSLRVALLFQTPSTTAKTIADPDTTYNLNGVVLGPFPDDRRIRRAVTLTVNLRNRTP